MTSLLDHDEKKPHNEQVLMNDQSWDSEDDEDDSDYTPDRDNSDANDNDADSVTSAEELSKSPETPAEAPSLKRKSGEQGLAGKRTKIEGEEERKARVEAIWAEMNQRQEKQPLDDISSCVNRSAAPGREQETEKSPAARPAGRKRIVRPKSNLSALVSQYGIKVPKMNTLEKSRLDWQGYVDREGLRDDLKYKNKDGYMEKVAFLQRVDDRRLTHLKAGQKASKK